MVCPPAWSTTARTAGRQCRPRPDRSRAASANPVPATIHTRQGIRSWPSTSGRHDCAAPCRTETRAPACTPRTAPTTRRSAPGAARRTRHRRRRSRTPGPPATPTRPRGPHSGSARESSLPAGPAPRLQNPQPMSELRNHPRKLTPNSATFTRTGHPPATMSRPVEDCEGCPALAGVRNLGLDDPSAGRPDSHCNSGDRRIRACRAAAALSQFPQAGPGPYGRNCSAPTPSRNDHTCRAGRGGFTPDGALI